MNHRPASVFQQGFTLLELMLVILVLGLLVSAIRLSIPGHPSQQAHKLAQRLGAQLQLAQQQAVMKNQDLGLRFASDQYAFFQLGNHQWQPLPGDSPLAQTLLPESLSLQLTVANQPIDLHDSPAPQVLLLSDGQVTAFELAISTTEPETTLSIEVGLLGDVTIHDKSATHER